MIITPTESFGPEPLATIEEDTRPPALDTDAPRVPQPTLPVFTTRIRSDMRSRGKPLVFAESPHPQNAFSERKKVPHIFTFSPSNIKEAEKKLIAAKELTLKEIKGTAPHLEAELTVDISNHNVILFKARKDEEIERRAKELDQLKKREKELNERNALHQQEEQLLRAEYESIRLEYQKLNSSSCLTQFARCCDITFQIRQDALDIRITAHQKANISLGMKQEELKNSYLILEERKLKFAATHKDTLFAIEKAYERSVAAHELARVNRDALPRMGI
jgi:hypothetical protein